MLIDDSGGLRPALERYMRGRRHMGPLERHAGKLAALSVALVGLGTYALLSWLTS